MESIILPADLRPISIGAGNNDVVYAMTQRGRLDSKGDDNWTILQFTEHSLQTGAALGAGPFGKHKLNGKVTPNSYVRALAMPKNAVLFVVVVHEGHAGSEVPFLHGYHIEAVSLRSKSNQVFRVPLTSPNAVAAMDENGRVFLLDQGVVLVLEKWVEAARIEWPQDDLPIVSLAAFDDCLYTIDTNMRIASLHLADTTITRHSVCYETNANLVLVDKSCANRIVQSEDSVFVLNSDQLWEVELDSEEFYGHCHATKETNSNLELANAITVSKDRMILVLAQSIMSAHGSQILKIPIDSFKNVH